MTRLLLGVSLGLTWFLLINAAVSLAVAGALRVAVVWGWRSSTARFVLAVRLLPSLAGVGGLLGFVLPAYVALEPADAVEPLGAGLILLALVSIGLFARAALRAGLAWWLARAEVREWLRDAERIDAAVSDRDGRALPTYVVSDPRPIVALAGVRRPRLFIARHVADHLTGEELSAAIAHERGHLTSRDNLKRLLLRACPDVLSLLPDSRDLERAWAGAAELAADGRATGADARRAAALASAILKVARMLPPPQPIAAPVSTLHDGGVIAERIRTLIAPDSSRAGAPRGSWMAVAMLAGLAAVAAGDYPALLFTVHQVSEALVRLFA